VRAFLRQSGQGTAGGIAGITQEAMEISLPSFPGRGTWRELQAVVEPPPRWPATSSPWRRSRDRETAPNARRPPGPVPHRAPAAGGTHPILTGGRCESEAFGNLSYREVMVRYFAHLYRKTGGAARACPLAGIAKAPAYEWKDKYGGGC